MNLERRRKPRISDAVPVIVRSLKGRDMAYQFETVTLDVGAGGLCAFAPRRMEEGETVSLHIRFRLAGSMPSQAPCVAARAVVARVEKRPDNSCVFAVTFRRYRFV